MTIFPIRGPGTAFVAIAASLPVATHGTWKRRGNGAVTGAGQILEIDASAGAGAS